MERRQNDIESGKFFSSRTYQVRTMKIVVAHPVSYYVSYFEVLLKNCNLKH